MTLPEACRASRRKVPSNVAEAMTLAEELFQQVDEFCAQIGNDASRTIPVAESGVVSLTSSLEKASVEVVDAKVELAEIRLSAESVAKEHQVGFATMREER